MLLARFCDERQWGYNRQGKAPFVVPVSGHEAAQVGSGWAFERGKDVFCPYYRDLALMLVAGLTPKDVFLGLFGKKEDPSSGGRQMPAHWGSQAAQHHHRVVPDRDAVSCTRPASRTRRSTRSRMRSSERGSAKAARRRATGTGR